MCTKRDKDSRTCLLFSTSQIVVWFQLWVPTHFLSCLVAEAGCGFGGLCWTDGHSQQLPLQVAMICAFVQEQWDHLQSHSILSWVHVTDPFTGSAQAPLLPWQNSLEAIHGKACTDFTSHECVTPQLQRWKLSTLCFPSHHQHVNRK